MALNGHVAVGYWFALGKPPGGLIIGMISGYCHGGVGNGNAELSNDWIAAEPIDQTVDTMSHR
jgi:hypothetical protein